MCLVLFEHLTKCLFHTGISLSTRRMHFLSSHFYALFSVLLSIFMRDLMSFPKSLWGFLEPVQKGGSLYKAYCDEIKSDP